MGLRLHPEHGVAPFLDNCFYCGESRGLVLAGMSCNKLAMAAGQKEGYSRWGNNAICSSKEPCDKCKGYMDQGIILIGVDEKKTTDMDNPYRTGRFAVVRDRVIEQAVTDPELSESILKARVAFMPDEVFEMLGIPESM